MADPSAHDPSGEVSQPDGKAEREILLYLQLESAREKAEGALERLGGAGSPQAAEPAFNEAMKALHGAIQAARELRLEEDARAFEARLGQAQADFEKRFH